MFCSTVNNAAKRRYTQSSMGVAISYVGFVFGSKMFVNHWHPQGWHLWLAAALPSIPLLCFAWIVARYLREESDEYQRDLLVRGMLWGTAAVLALAVFTDFLRSYGWTGQLPPFTLFVLFWIVASLAKMSYAMANRAVADE